MGTNCKISWNLTPNKHIKIGSQNMNKIKLNIAGTEYIKQFSINLYLKKDKQIITNKKD